MTKEQIEAYSEAMKSGSIPDDRNPLCLLQGVHTDLLVKIVAHAFDMVVLARLELEHRGLNKEGHWVGFAVAQELNKQDHKLKTKQGIKMAKRRRKI